MDELDVKNLDLESLVELEEILEGMNDELNRKGEIEDE